VNLFLAR